MEIFQGRKEFTVEEICVCLGLDTVEVRQMLRNSGSLISDGKFGKLEKISRKDISQLMALHSGSEIERKLSFLFMK